MHTSLQLSSTVLIQSVELKSDTTNKVETADEECTHLFLLLIASGKLSHQHFTFQECLSTFLYNGRVEIHYPVQIRSREMDFLSVNQVVKVFNAARHFSPKRSSYIANTKPIMAASECNSRRTSVNQNK